MAGKRLEIHPEALEEFKTTVTWYLSRSESGAHNFVSDVDQAVELVLESPERWPVFDHQTRRFVLRRFPFAIVYREKEAAVQILAVAHCRRKPGYWKKRG